MQLAVVESARASDSCSSVHVHFSHDDGDTTVSHIIVWPTCGHVQREHVLLKPSARRKLSKACIESLGNTLAFNPHSATAHRDYHNIFLNNS